MRLLLVLLLLPLPVHALHAQLGIVEGLFDHIEDVGVYGMAGRFADRPAALDGERAWGFGLEASFRLGSIGWRGPEAIAVKELDTVQVVSETRGGRPVRESYTVKVTERDSVPPGGGPVWEAEIALGYSELHGLSSARAGLDLRGSIRELPSVAVYLSYRPNGTVIPYLGIRSGLAELHGFRGYVGDPAAPRDPDALYTGAASSFQFGAALGLAVDALPGITVFLEPSYTFRQFSGIEWEADGDGTVPDVLPRALDLSTFNLSAGLQIGLGDR